MYSVCIKPIEFFQPDPSNPRKDFAQDELRLLGESLRKKQHIPLIARKSGVLVDGERRWRAATMQSETRSRSKKFYDDHSAFASYAGEKMHSTGRSAFMGRRHKKLANEAKSQLDVRPKNSWAQVPLPGRV